MNFIQWFKIKLAHPPLLFFQSTCKVFGKSGVEMGSAISSIGSHQIDWKKGAFRLVEESTLTTKTLCEGII